MDYSNEAHKLDQQDELKVFRDRFLHEDGLIYLDGNSLGRLPLESLNLITGLARDQWGRRLIRSWNEEWLPLSKRLSEKIARLIGAHPEEIYVGDPTTLNLYKLAYGVLKRSGDKQSILTDDMNFPADIYILEGLINTHFNHKKLLLHNTLEGSKSDITDSFNDHTALCTLSLVSYKNAFKYDMERINKAAQEHGCPMIWDLSHAVGAIDLDMHQSKTEMAVGCTYKYLNGGPGAPSFLYIRKDLQEHLDNPVTSWFSHHSPFDFSLTYSASASIQKMAISTPSILSMACIEPGLDLQLEAGTKKLEEKSKSQSSFLIKMCEKYLFDFGFEMLSPTDADKRGSHIALGHPEAYRITQAMINPSQGAKVIIPDFRPPNIIRMGITPLYTSYRDLYETVIRIMEIMVKKEYKAHSEEIKGVS